MTTQKDASIRVSKEARKALRIKAINKGITLKALVDNLAGV